MSVGEYVGRFAEYYDLCYADKPYEAEAAFVDGCLRRWSAGECRKLLELACGTGRHTLALERLGYEVVALDRSGDMIGRAEQKRRAGGSKVRFLEGDMRSFSAPGAPFDAAVCLFDSLGYAVTNEGVLQTLRRVREHLRPGGLFLCEYWHGPAMLRRSDRVRYRHWETADGQLWRVSESTLDLRNQTCAVKFNFVGLGRDGTYWRHGEAHLNRYFSVPEMRLFLTSAGLTPLGEYGGFAEEAPIDDSAWHIVAVAQKPPAAGGA